MTIDPSVSVSTLPKIAGQESNASPSPLRPSRNEQEQWKKLRKRILKRRESSAPRDVLTAAKSGVAYRWGMAASLEGPLPRLVDVLSRLGCDSKVTRKQIEACDLSLAAENFCDQRPGSVPSPIDDAIAVLWASAMPGLCDKLETRIWWDVLGKLQLLSERARESDDAGSVSRLMLGGELGMTLAWRLADLPSCRRLRERSVKAVKSWLEMDAQAIAAAVVGVRDARLVLGSAVRCDDLIRNTTKQKLARRHREIIAELATWVGGLTNPGGVPVFCPASSTNNEPHPPNKSDALVSKTFSDDVGLLRAAIRFDEETLRPAIEAALGATQTGGRLAWEVCLPESLIHCEDAKVAVMMPEWDVRRGRTVVDYGGEDCRIELHAGRRKAFAGVWQAMISVDGDEQLARGPWESTCEFTDDDVHYVELEQPWSGGVTLQRQVVVIRDDRCVLLADNVLLDEPGEGESAKKIQYTGRLPLTNELVVDPEAETREVCLRSPAAPPKTLKQKSKKSAAAAIGKPQALAIPLAASEWRVGPTACELSASEDHHLVMSTTAMGGLCAPLWLDLSPRRIKRKRTWRQLTIADDLRVSRRDEAVAFRVQMGSEHWMVYRSLGEPRVRSVLGKHLIADFFAARFHPGDGGLEELVTVECNDDA